MRLKPTTSYIRSFAWVFLVLFLGAGKAAALPQPAHIVIVIEENHDYTQIIGTSQAVTAPYWNSLANAGALMTNSHGYSHNSEDNYMALFDGDPYDGTGPSALNYGTDGDTYPLPVSMASNANLANSLILGGYTFAGYSEDIPSAGSTVATATGSVAGHTSSGFAAKHNPWLDFQVGHGAFGNIPATCNQPMTTFQGISDYSTLPTVSIVVPDLWNDIHDGPVSVGDQWMQNNLGNYATYCQNPANNSLLILTWDENVAGNDTDSNRIPTVFYGSMVTPGSYAESINHYNVLKTLLTMYNLSPIGAATSASITVISDIFQPANTSTSTATATSTNTPTLTPTPSATGTNSFTLTITNTTTDSATNTPTTTDTPTMTGTLTIATTSTATNSATNSSTNSSTNTATNTATTTSTNTATNISSATSTSTVSSTFTSTSSFTATATVCLPRPDHIVILIDSDEPYANVLGASQSVTAPYFNSLAATGAVLTNYNGLSTGGAEPNWIGLFSGQTKVTGDTCPTGPYTDANLASELIAGGFSFSGYSEGIPSAGSTVCSSGTGNAMYVAKHAPWVFFSNLNQTTVGQSFTAFQGISDYSTLPSVSIVVPNEADDIRLGTAGASSITEGDTWAKTNLDAYYKWAMGHNSLFVVMFDYVGSSSVGPVPMIINGPMVVPGTYSTSANHYNLLATLEDMYGIPLTGGAVTATAMTQMFNCTGTFPTVTNTPTLNTPTFTNTGTGTFTSTAVNTSTATATSTFTNSFTNTVVNTTTDTPSFTFTSTLTNTPVSTDTPSSTATNTFTNTSATTDTATNTATSTLTNTLTPTITPTATITNTPIGGLAPGSIAFSGLLGNGDNQISFVPLTTISAGTTIFFTNEAWDNTANSGNGGLVDKTGLIVTGSTEDDSIIQYVATSGLSAYNQVIIGKTSGTTQINQLFGGSVAYVSGAGSTSASPWLVMNNTVKGNKVLAFTSTLSAPSTTNVNSSNVSFLTAAIFGPDSWTTSGSPVNAYDTYLPPGLDATTSSDLSTLWNSSATFTAQAAGGQDNAVQSNPSSTLAGLVNPYNWSGNVSTKTGFRLNQPVSVTAPSAGQGGWNVTDSVEVFNFTPTSTATNTAVNTNTATATFTPTATLTNTVVNTPTNTSTNSSTNTATNTSTSTATNTSTNTSTNTVSGTTDTATNTATSTFTMTLSFTATATSTGTSAVNTNTATNTSTSTSTSTATSTSTNTSTNTVSGATDTATNTATSTFTMTPSFTATATSTGTSAVNTNTATNTTTATLTNTGTVTPLTATNTATNTSTASFTSTPTFTNTVTNSSTVTSTATNTATSTFTNRATSTYTNTITNTPQATSTPTNSSTVTSTVTATSTSTFTSTPTATPSFTATSTGTLGTPTSTATSSPTSTKTVTPTVTPTATTAPIEEAQKVVGANQSTSCDLSNGAGVQVPAGVFSAGTTLTVMEFAPSTAPPASSGFQTILGNIYTFDASSGNTDNFSTPVTMTFPVSASVLDKYSDQQLQVAYYNAATQRWQTLNTIVDRHRDVLTVVTNHFSMWTVVADAFLSSSTAGGGNILAPVPANSGDSVCLYTAQSVASSTWSIYSVTGYHVATVSYSNSEGSQCWNTQGVGRGLYYVKLVLTYVGGTSVTEWHKVVVK